MSAYPRFIGGKAYCAICDAPHVARGYCAKHYQRFMKYGDPNFKKHFYRGEQENMKCPYCGAPAEKKGLCALHYRRIKNTGTPYLRGSLELYGRV